MIELGFAERALLVGCGLTLLTGPMGSIIVWRRMAYFGETLGHSTLLGASIAYWWDINLYIGLIVFCLLSAGLLTLLTKNRHLSLDSLLGLLAHGALAAGLIVASQLQGSRISLLSYLQGDILSVNNVDIIWTYIIAFIGLIILQKIWPGLITLIVHEEIARVEGIKVQLIQWIQITLMAVIFALAMKLIGVLLLTALLIIPAITARQFSRSPEGMALWAIVFGALSVSTGIACSIYYDWPTGPAIVIAASGWFIISLLVKGSRKII